MNAKFFDAELEVSSKSNESSILHADTRGQINPELDFQEESGMFTNIFTSLSVQSTRQTNFSPEFISFQAKYTRYCQLSSDDCRISKEIELYYELFVFNILFFIRLDL